MAESKKHRFMHVDDWVLECLDCKESRDPDADTDGDCNGVQKDVSKEKAFRVYATRTLEVSGVVFAETAEEAQALAEDGDIDWADVHDSYEDISEVEEIKGRAVLAEE